MNDSCFAPKIVFVFRLLKNLEIIYKNMKGLSQMTKICDSPFIIIF